MINNFYNPQSPLTHNYVTVITFCIIFIILCVMVYLEIVIINVFNMDYNTQIMIDQRAKVDLIANDISLLFYIEEERNSDINSNYQ